MLTYTIGFWQFHLDRSLLTIQQFISKYGQRNHAGQFKPVISRSDCYDHQGVLCFRQQNAKVVKLFRDNSEVDTGLMFRLHVILVD